MLLVSEMQKNKYPQSLGGFVGIPSVILWWAVRDSNPRQSVCKTDTLPTELTAREGYL